MVKTEVQLSKVALIRDYQLDSELMRICTFVALNLSRLYNPMFPSHSRSLQVENGSWFCDPWITMVVGEPLTGDQF